LEKANVQPIRLVIFDIAGTIIADRGEVMACFARALRNNGITAEHDELRQWRGASKREVIRHFVAREAAAEAVTARTDHVYQDFRQILESYYENEGVQPIEGAESTFDWLRERKISIATTTGFYGKVRDLILRKAGWQQRFQSNVCSSDVTAGRPAPLMIFRAMEIAGVADVAEVLNVGDTPLDLQAGTRAGVRGVVGVLTGIHDAATLRQEPHTHILRSVALLPALLRDSFGVE